MEGGLLSSPAGGILQDEVLLCKHTVIGCNCDSWISLKYKTVHGPTN